MRALWTEHSPEFHGKYNDFPPIRCYPQPIQDPHPPVLLGAINNPRSLKRVAEWGDGWVPLVQSVEEFQEGVQQITSFCKDINRDPSEIDFTVFGIGDQWKSKEEIERLSAAGANRVVLWLNGVDTDELKSELDSLASMAL